MIIKIDEFQGGNKRPGAFAIYLEPRHADIFDFLDLRKNHGKEEQRARDLFYALWIPDLFMKRVEEDGMWSLMCPHASPGLHECWGEKFEDLYTKYEREGKFMKQVRILCEPSQNVWPKLYLKQWVLIEVEYLSSRTVISLRSSYPYTIEKLLLSSLN